MPPAFTCCGVGEPRDVGQRPGHPRWKPAPSVSQHLAKLRMARLVRTRREGTTIFYSLDNDHIRQLVTDAVFNASTPDRAYPATIATPPNWRPCTLTDPTPTPIWPDGTDADHDPRRCSQS